MESSDRNASTNMQSTYKHKTPHTHLLTHLPSLVINVLCHSVPRPNVCQHVSVDGDKPVLLPGTRTQMCQHRSGNVCAEEGVSSNGNIMKDKSLLCGG